MLLDPLAKSGKFAFFVNDNNEALIMHKGTLHEQYCWIQFDPLTGTVQLITEDGKLQEMGFVIPKPAKVMIEKAGKITLIEIDEKNTWHQHKLVFINVLT